MEPGGAGLGGNPGTDVSASVGNRKSGIGMMMTIGCYPCRVDHLPPMRTRFLSFDSRCEPARWKEKKEDTWFRVEGHELS
jgi:hypothetical protein